MDPQQLPTIEHAGMLEDLHVTPGHVLPGHAPAEPLGAVSCSYCGVGDSGFLVHEPVEQDGGGLEAGFVPEGTTVYQHAVTVTRSRIIETVPTAGCVKLKHSRMLQRSAFPIHIAPTALRLRPLFPPYGGGRKGGPEGSRTRISYDDAIARLADLVLAHRPPAGRTLIYACGQIDYFTIFAMQEVFRLLGVRNLTGNAEHCLNAGAVHNEILTGQEGPFLTIDQAINGPDRCFLFNGWNGYVTHPPVFAALQQREDLDAYLVEVVVTETAKALAKKLDPERVLLIRPRADAHLALGVANEILREHADAVDRRFIERFADAESLERFVELARSPSFEPERVAARIAPEPRYAERLYRAMRVIAHRLAAPSCVPIAIPSVGLSQTSGVVAHCVWGSTLALLGKYGLKADGTPAGGVLRLPGQINAESEVQGLSRKYFFGRIPMENAGDAAARMGLPADAYEAAANDVPRAALDYSDPTPDTPELFLCFGTQFESNMMDRRRFIRKLEDPDTKLVVIDPVPDPFSVARAGLIIPSPPHPAATKVYQNGEWKLSVSIPTKRAAPDTRSDPTIIYDLMAEITGRLERDPELQGAHPDLARHVRSGYLRSRFCPPEAAGTGNGAPHGPGGLARIDGEVSRPQLWERVQDYMGGGCGPLYCRPEHADGRPIDWAELLTRGSIIYGGVGTRRYRLDYDDPACQPFGDVFRRPRPFRFFTPTPEDLSLPEGIILTSGRSSLSDERERVQFATSTFNSGKATPTIGMPDENPLFVPPALAARLGLKDGARARVTSRDTGESEMFPVVVSDRVKGETCYISFHKCRAELEEGRYVNTITSHLGRCPYTAQTTVKATQILLEPALEPPPLVLPETAVPASGGPVLLLPGRGRPDTTTIDPYAEIPVWSGQNTPLYVTDVIQETHDVMTFRFQGDPPCRFVYLPGQFCTLVLNINGNKVLRSYSISSSPTRPFALEITVKRCPEGLVSNWLPDNLEIGSQIEISGPKGRFCLTPGGVPRKLLFLAAGSGITPLISMSRWLCDLGADVDMVFLNSVRSPDDIIFERELEWLTRYRTFRPIHVTCTRDSRRGWSGLSGQISEEMLQMACPDVHERQVYMCGPEGFMDCARGILAEAGFDLSRLHAESFGGVRTAADNKPAPVRQKVAGAHAVLPAAAPAATAPAGHLTVEFARSGKTAKTDGRMPLLDFAEANDVELDYACRSGTCGSCKARLLQGKVAMDADDGLDASDRAAGFILTCVATPKTDVVLDA